MVGLRDLRESLPLIKGDRLLVGFLDFEAEPVGIGEAAFYLVQKQAADPLPLEARPHVELMKGHGLGVGRKSREGDAADKEPDVGPPRRERCGARGGVLAAVVTAGR